MQKLQVLTLVIAVLFFSAFSTQAGTIHVAAGTYTENLTLNKANVTITGAGSGTTTIIGAHTVTANSVSLSEFTLTVAANDTGVIIDSSGSAISNTSITNCIFDMTTGPVVGVNIGGAVPTNLVSNTAMTGCTFNGPTTFNANPWKIGGGFTVPLNAAVTNVDFTGNTVNKCSIPVNLGNGNIDDILVDNNTFNNTDGCIYVWDDRGTAVTGVLSNFVFSNNNVDSTNTYGLALGGAALSSLSYTQAANDGTGNVVVNNNFDIPVGAYGFGAVSNSIDGLTLVAQNNYWGSYAGPAATDAGGRLGSIITVENFGVVDSSSITLGAYRVDTDTDATNDDTDTDDDGDGYSDALEELLGTAGVPSNQLNSGLPTAPIDVYVDDLWSDGTSDPVIGADVQADIASVAVPTIFGYAAFATIQEAINVVN